jgi:hypothetical protein
MEICMRIRKNTIYAEKGTRCRYGKMTLQAKNGSAESTRRKRQNAFGAETRADAPGRRNLNEKRTKIDSWQPFKN